MRHIVVNFIYEYNDQPTIMAENLGEIYSSFEEAEKELPWMYMAVTKQSLPIESRDQSIRVWRDADIKQDYNYVIMFSENNPFFCLNCLFDTFDGYLEQSPRGPVVVKSFVEYLRKVLINPSEILKS